MFLFIFESIGTSEMILVGIVALIFLGPRKLPELAKKAGKIMAEFRGTASEFKETWQREASFDEEAKALSLSTLDEEIDERGDYSARPEINTAPDAPAIKAADPEAFKHLMSDTPETVSAAAEPAQDSQTNDKKNWL